MISKTKTMRDVYALTFEILDLEKELKSMKEEYSKKKERLLELKKEEALIIKGSKK